MLMTPNEYIRKLQRETSMKKKYGRAVMTVSEQMQEELEPLPEPLPDLGEEAEDEILISTGKINPTDEKLMECVYKKELGSDFETMDDGVAVGFVDFTEDSEYKRLQYLLKSKTRYKRLLKIQARARGEKE